MDLQLINQITAFDRSRISISMENLAKCLSSGIGELLIWQSESLPPYAGMHQVQMASF